MAIIQIFMAYGKKPREDAPVKPEKEIPTRPDKNPDPTKPRPGGNEPEKNDPTRIENPPKTDPTRIEPSQPQKKLRLVYHSFWYPMPAA